MLNQVFLNRLKSIRKFSKYSIDLLSCFVEIIFVNIFHCFQGHTFLKISAMVNIC